MPSPEEYAAFKQNLMLQPDIMAQLEALPPEEQEAQMQRMFRDYAGEEAIFSEQAATAKALRGKAGPEGRSHGDVYVAANPLEHIASGIEKYRAGEDYDEAMQGMEDLSTSRSEGIRGVAELFAGGTGPKDLSPEQKRLEQQKLMASMVRDYNADELG